MDFLIHLLSTPAIQTLITLGLTAAVGYINKSWAEQARWDSVTRIATSVVSDLYNKGLHNWQDIAKNSMTVIVKEIQDHPGIKNLSEKEVEALKPLVVRLAKRKNGAPVEELLLGPSGKVLGT